MIDFAILLRVCLLAVVAFAPVRAEAQQATGGDQRQLAAATDFQGDVYILSGGFGVFSTGLGKLKAQLEQKGVEATLVSYKSWRGVAQKIVRHRQQHGRKPVVIIGHSLGANNAVLIADDLKKKSIQVDLIVSYASTAPMTVPSNVRNVYNFYFESGGWGHIFTAGSGFGGTLNNVDMSKRSGMTHFNVDDSPDLRDEVVRNVLRYVRPAQAPAEQHKMREG